MMLIDKVRATTSDLHKTLDHSLIPYIQAVHSKNEYADLLVSFYGFFKPVYDQIDTNIDLTFLPDYLTRRRPEWILNDLDNLEINYNIEICSDLPAITNNSSAFGALYVLEGSTLGGMVISKMISSKIQVNNSLSFFSGYGKQTRERWNVFIKSLNSLENINNAAGETIIQAAAATFTLFKDWLQQVTLLQRL